MSLSDILDEIREGTEPVDDTINLKTNPDGLSTEEIRSMCVKWDGFRVEIATIDKGLMAKFNNLCRRCELKRATTGMSKVDKSVAQEAMATLPAISPIHEAKLTTAPSALNKKIIDDIVFSQDDRVPEDMISIVKGLYTEITDNIKKADAVYEDFKGTVEEIKDVIATKGQKPDDYLSTMGAAVSDSERPVVEGILKTVRELTNCYTDDYLVTVKDFISGLELTATIARQAIRAMKEFVAEASPYLESPSHPLDSKINHLVVSVTATADHFERFNRIYKLVGDDGGDLMVLKRVIERSNPPRGDNRDV